MKIEKFSSLIEAQISRVEPKCRFKVCLSKRNNGKVIYKLHISSRSKVLGLYLNDFSKWQKQSVSPLVIIVWMTEVIDDLLSGKLMKLRTKVKSKIDQS